jgi:hypothetical protein
MTEAEWQSGSDPDAMLEFLWGRASERKLRLFAAACCRRVWPRLKDERSEGAVEVLERWADGTASREELVAAHGSAWEAWGTPARTAVADASAVDWSLGGALQAASHAAWAVKGPRAEERKAQADLLRCLWGNPFRPLPQVDRSWRAWHDGTVARLAQAMYEARDFSRMGLLADALLDAGCADEALLAHCRLGGDHVRGCWALDLVLGKS